MSGRAREVPEVAEELDERVEALGYELVQVEWAGSVGRPILRLRVDLPHGSERALAGESVNVDDCTVVSRGLESWLDGLSALPDKYVLEVSSPGVDRPLTRDRDWVRFVGEVVAVKGPEPLAGRATRLEGELVGLEKGAEGREIVRLRLPKGEELEIPREEITGAHVVFRWT